MTKKTPRQILTYLFHRVWKYSDVIRDHRHADIDNWVDEPPVNGTIKTVCRKCGEFIGYRPQFHAERGWRTKRT